MNRRVSTLRRALLATLLAAGVSACAAHGDVYPQQPPAARLVQVELYDRTSGSTLDVYTKNGRRYVVGTPGHEYALRIRNTTGGRILVVGSVDGVNVISGDTAAPSQSGYVLAAWDSVEIAGWRKSLERTAAFFFTDHSSSYAARTGRPDNVGVIGVAAFREKPKPVVLQDLGRRRAQPAAPAEAAAGSATRSADAAEPGLREESARLAAKPAPSLGTGHGRDEASRVTLVAFERASVSPAEVVTIQYDRRENLVALGVVPPVPPRYSQSEPNPFPGIRFTPDPPQSKPY
jgi:hypothetical protein